MVAGDRVHQHRGVAATPSVTAALAGHFHSIDSAPVGYSVHRRPADTNSFLVTFVALSLLGLTVLGTGLGPGALGQHRDLVIASGTGGIVRVPLRLFVVVFFCSYALYAWTDWWRRVALAVEMVGLFLVGCAAIDVLSALATRQGLTVQLFAQQLVSLVLALGIFPLVVMRHAQLPTPTPSPVLRRVPVRPFALLVLVLVASLGVAAWVEDRFFDQVVALRSVALLGGLGAGVFLAQQLFVGTLAAIGTWRVRRGRRHEFAPGVAVLIAAHNEAHGIAETIAAVDRAAAHYDGWVRVYIVDNCSRDHTAAAALAALSACEQISGEVLACDVPGKAVALNLGLNSLREPFVVRIDADTVISDDCLSIAMRHFADPTVGAVGGMPLPRHQHTLIDRVRLIEVLLRHGWFQIALGGYDGVLGVPGMFAVYRAEAVEVVGGTTEGMNGEDVDICLRMNTAGYRTVADPAAVYHSETPADFEHLREQRTRWFRSIYHISAHNRPALLRGWSVGGAVVLPFMLASAARRAMLTPLLLFCTLVVAIFGGVWPALPWQPVAAIVLGLPMLVTIWVCLLRRRPGALLYLPHYLFFRLVRSYFTLGAALTLVYPLAGPRWGARARDGPGR